MRYHILESGSKGNSTIIKSNKTVIVIDNGLSKKKFLQKIADLSISFEDIDAVFITHGHDDHIAGIKIFNPYLLYSSSDTFDYIDNKFEQNKSDEYHIIEPYKTYKIKDLEILTIPTSHDAKGSIGFIIKDEEDTLVYITDTGYIYEKALLEMQNASYYIIESNHDVKMLLNTSRPQSLKDRILGDKGHLSNEDCAIYLSEIIGPNTKEIVFAHISEEANKEETVINAFLKIMEKRGISLENILFRCASQHNTVSGGNVLKEGIINA